MNAAEYTSEYICRFPMSKEIPAFWLSLASVSHCGTEKQNRPGTTLHTAIVFVVSGSGTLCTKQEIYQLAAGDVCILGEDTQYAFQTDTKEPWTQMVFHMTGTATFPFVQAFGLEKKRVYRNCAQLRPVFEQLLACVKQNVSVEQIMEQCGMLIMKLFARLCQMENQDTTIADDVRQVKRFIDNNYHKNLTMDEIAACVYRSNDYVQKQFKQAYGMTPFAYYMDLKMRCAKSLLQQTNLSISQIAERLGYKSDRYFSVRFHKTVGMVAMEYRRISREEAGEEYLWKKT